MCLPVQKQQQQQQQNCFWRVSAIIGNTGILVINIYCPGSSIVNIYYMVYAAVKGNDPADRLADKAAIKSSLRLGRSVKTLMVLRSLRHYLRTQNREHHAIDRLEERGVERGSAPRRFSLKGRKRAIVNQTNIGTVSKATLGKVPRDRVEHIRTFPSA